MNDTVVFIDDQRSFDTIIRAAVKQTGAELIILDSAADGVVAIKEKAPRLIICDGLDGQFQYVLNASEGTEFILLTATPPKTKDERIRAIWNKTEISIAEMRRVVGEVFQRGEGQFPRV